VNQDALESAPGLVAKLCGCDPAPRPHPGPKPVEKSSLRCSGNQITELPAFGTSGCKEIVLPSWSRAHGLILRRLQGRDRLSPDKRGEPVCHRKNWGRHHDLRMEAALRSARSHPAGGPRQAHPHPAAPRPRAAERIGEFWGHPETRTFGRAADRPGGQGVQGGVWGLLWEMEQK
jgi:hypothetical protein